MAYPVGNLTFRRDRLSARLRVPIVAALAGAFATALVLSPGVSGADDGVYRWWLRSDTATGAELVVLPYAHDDWDEYIDASNDRLDRWVSRPELAPPLERTFTAVTFTRPVTAPLAESVVESLHGTVVRCTSIGSDDAGRLVEELSPGGPSPGELGSVRYDPGADYRFTLLGVVTCVVRIGVAGSVTPRDLDAVRSRPFVYLIDTTPIQVHRVLLPNEPAWADADLTALIVDSPWHLLTR